MRRLMVGLMAVAVLSCGSQNEINLPFAGSSLPTMQRAPGQEPVVPTQSSQGPRNAGTQVWLVPPPAGDMMELARQPQNWPVQERVDVFSFYFLQAYDHPGYECGVPCGPNTYQALVNAVPGGVFQWMDQRFTLAMEGVSVKSWSCTAPELMDRAVMPTVRALDNVVAAGARIAYLSMDEPFASGTATPERSPFGDGQGCNLSAQAVAALQRQYNDAVLARHPQVQIGFVEPYPHLSADEIMADLVELEHAGVAIPYFHLDFDLERAVREKSHWPTEVVRIRDFCQARGIPFGVIYFGADGTSNEAFATGSVAVTQAIASVLGVQQHTIIQSWAESQPGNNTSSKAKPDTVPQSQPGTQTWLLDWTLQFLRIEPFRR